MESSTLSASRSVVVLGGGFVGGAVCDALERRFDVTRLDIPTHPVLAARGADARRFLQEQVDESAASAVVNCCGLLRGTDEEMNAANALWPRWLLEVLDGRGVRFIHLGSASEYGDPGDDRPLGEDRPANPSGTYGETKWAGSSAVIAARNAGMNAVVIRGFNLVAPDLPPVSPLHQFLSDVDALPSEGGTVELWWPDTVRDFILLTDLAEAVALLIQVAEVPPIVNACSGVGLAFAEVVQAIAARRGKPVTIDSLDRPGIPVVIGDPGLLERTTGLRPAMSAGLLASTICGHIDSATRGG